MVKQTISHAATVINKTAEITLIFWLMKITATTLGETLGDYLSMTLGLGYTISIYITFIFFAVVLAAQLIVKKYIPFIFWLLIAATTTLGTEISDFIDRTLHLGYATGSLLLVTLLAITLIFWFIKYKNLQVYPITEKPKELYFWAAVLFSNSLGTAFGDYLSDNMELKYFYGAIITGVIIGVVAVLHYYTKINRVILFWIAFIFTRPFGATFGDLLTKSKEQGGLALGTLLSSLISIIILIILIFLSHVRQQNALKRA